MKGINNVSEEVVDYFTETAKQIIEEKGGLNAMCRALAYISGHTEKISERSLITTENGLVTYLLKFDSPDQDAYDMKSTLKEIMPESL